MTEEKRQTGYFQFDKMFSSMRWQPLPLVESTYLSRSSFHCSLKVTWTLYSYQRYSINTPTYEPACRIIRYVIYLHILDTGYWNLNKLKHFALTCIKVCQIKDFKYLLNLYCCLWIEQYLEIYSVLVEGLRKWIANTKIHIDFTHQSPVIL